MTYVGRILVLVITALSLLFLGVSTVVFTTARNWKEAKEVESKKVQDLQSKSSQLTAQLDAANKELVKVKESEKAALKQQETIAAGLQASIDAREKEIADTNSKLENAQVSAKLSLEDATARKQETELLREQKLAVEKQANDFKIRQAELNDEIRELKRMLETATNNANDLRDRVARFSTLLRRNGLSDDITAVKGLESPPAVQGQVARVKSDNRSLEITIGSDDGLVAGHELFLYRVQPQPEFLGKIKVISVDPDQSVARVIGATINGKKIREGDIVSSTIRPRS